ncbi:FAD/NAD(P)-binding domain-containing protein [Mycena latifolia]|nr:FAD/NAD(P)-binding domain-containing protein [Mycena latifolia]
MRLQFPSPPEMAAKVFKTVTEFFPVENPSVMPESLHEPLHIHIVGAGLGGLAAAVSLRRQGHRVEIFETSFMNKEIGAAITVQANAMRVLEYFGYIQESLKGVDFLGTVRYSSLSREGGTNVMHFPNDTLGRAGWMCHRSDLHDELKRLAIGEEGTGPPARLHLGQEVADCDPVEGILTLKNGEVHHGDLVIGADGIHSVIRTSVLGHEQKALATGMSTFRFLFDAAKMKSVPDMDWFSEGISGARVVVAPEARFRMLFLSSCRHGDVVNVVAHHVDDRDQDKYDWSAPATVDEVLDEFKNFHPRYLKFLSLADPPILRWQLRALPLLPTWINGRTALLGDAAHATLPTLGQGAGMALEDAATIGCLLPMGATRADIPARLAAYQELRKPRGELVNRESLEQATVPAKRGLYARSRELQAVLVGYDAVETTKKYYEEHFQTS